MRSLDRAALSLTQVARHRVVIIGTLVVLATVSVVLGCIGWWQYSRTPDGAEVDLPAVLYGTIGLFVFVGDVATVPWPLAVARITAPLTTLGVALAAVLAFSETRVHRHAARGATDHLVVLGPADRAAPYLRSDPAADRSRPNMVVRLDSDEGAEPERAGVPTATVAVDVDPFAVRRDGWDGAGGPRPTDWVTASGAASATEAVIATGRDDCNTAALGVALERRVPAPGARLTVEIDDRSTALRLAVALSTDPATADADVQVVCRDEVLARLAVDELLAAGSAPTTASAAAATPAVVGDGPMVPLVAMELGRRLEAAQLAGGAERRPSLIVVDPDPSKRHARWLPSARTVDLTVDDDPTALLSPGRGPLVAFVDFADRERRSRYALELAASHPQHRVVALLGPGPLPFGDRLRSLDDQDSLRRAHMVGPFDRTDPPAPAATVRSMVRVLAFAGYGLRPSTGGDAHCELDRRTLQALAALDGADDDLAQDLVGILRSVGLTVTAPAEDG